MQTKPPSNSPDKQPENAITASASDISSNEQDEQDEPKDLNRVELPGHVQMSNVIGGILLSGVLISSAVIIIGLIMIPFHPGGLSTQRVETFPHTFATVWKGLLALQPQAVIVFGLLLLIATPVVRVAASVVAFGLEHDRRFVIITLIVLGILLASFFLGKGGA